MRAQQTRTIARQLRWWQGLACGLLVLALLAWGLPVVTADDVKHDDKKTLEERVAALEKLLKHFRREGNEVFIKGANLHIVNGLGSTDCTDEQGVEIPDCPNGLGKIIVGYNEPRKEVPDCESDPTNPFCIDTRTGSHNVVVGQEHNFSRFGGVVVGQRNTISGDFSPISGGQFNTASGLFAAVSGGGSNTASEFRDVVSGGLLNTASGSDSVVSGETFNRAIGGGSVISGGTENMATGGTDVVSGGAFNMAEGETSVISGGTCAYGNGGPDL
jgi:hypothetical protein